MLLKHHIPLLVATVVAGCSPGGGGGRYYPPRIAQNPYHIEKHVFDEPPAALTNLCEVPVKLGVDDSNDRYIDGDKYYYFSEVHFRGGSLTLAIPLDTWIAVVDSRGNVLTRLETPRYTRYAVGVELSQPESEPCLAILIDQQDSSHSSTLYILDSDLTPIYKEHLLGAKWIGKMSSADGDVLYVSSEDRWLRGDEWEMIGGNWFYNIFEALDETGKGPTMTNVRPKGAE